MHTPSFSTDLSADDAKPTQIGPFDIAAIFYHNDGFYWDPANQVRQPTYSIYNASIGWLNPQERFGVRWWGKNLGGAKYYSYAITQTPRRGFLARTPALTGPRYPRTSEVSLCSQIGIEANLRRAHRELFTAGNGAPTSRPSRDPADGNE